MEPVYVLSGDTNRDGNDPPVRRCQAVQNPQSAAASASQTGSTGEYYAWMGGPSGNWDDAANWRDLSTGAAATSVPGQNDSAVIEGGAGTIISGDGEAETLTLSGQIVIDGTLSTATLIDNASSLSLSGQGSLIVSSGVADGGSSMPTSAHPGDLTIEAGSQLIAPAVAPDAPIWNDGTLELTAGSAIPTGQILGDGTILVDSGFESQVAYAATYRIAPSIGADQHVRFNGPNASLYLETFGGDPSDPLLVENFAPGDDISVFGIVQTMQVVSTADGDLLALTELVGGVHGTISTQYIQFDRDYAAESLAFSTNFVETGAFDAGYTDITVSDAAACFCPGTLIATPGGDRLVEELRIGDPVLTEDGASRPVLWIGRRRYRWEAAAGRRDLIPVRIRAGALGAGLPKRDLLVSPKHAMLVQGVLVPAELLVNGRSVLQPEIDGDIAYLHVELENHEMLVAEGAATESFVDHDSRSVFENAAEYEALYPDHPASPSRCRAPRVEHGRRLVSAQAYMNALAGMLPVAARTAPRVQLDGIENGKLRGWAWCAEQPEAPMLLDILRGDVPVGQVLADRYRADLARAGIGTGCHGFEAPVPDGIGAITLRRAGDCRAVSA